MENQASRGIQKSEIAGVKKPVRPERALGLLRIVVVARGDVSAQKDQSGLSLRNGMLADRINDPELKAGKRRAVGGDLRFDWIVREADACIAVRLREPVGSRCQRNPHLDKRHALVFGISAGITLLEGCDLALRIVRMIQDRARYIAGAVIDRCL